MIIRFLIFALLFIPCPLWAASYYVSNSGSDSATGTSSNTPWQTIEKVNQSSFTGDDFIYFNRGDTWREVLIFPSSGSSGHPITIGAYGTGNAPLIAWDTNLMTNGGFETFTGTPDDTTTDNFNTWTENNTDADDLVLAVTDHAMGSYAAKLVSVGNWVDIRNTISVTAETTYTLTGYAKSGGSRIPNVFVRDINNAEYLQNDGSWGAQVALTPWATSSTSWTLGTKTFTTQAGCTEIRVDISFNLKNGSIYVDGFGLYQGSSAPDGVREKPGTINGMIDVTSKNYVTIRDLEIQGPRIDAPAQGTASYGVYIGGTSDHVIVRDTEVNRIQYVGVYSADTTSNTTFYQIHAHDNFGTGIAMNSDVGTVEKCWSHNNGNLSTDTGDRGGIGCTGCQDASFIGNTIWSNGQENTDCDFELSVVGASGNIDISRNRITDARQGGIQSAEATITTLTISYNIVDRFNTSTYGSGVTDGKWSAIKIGGGTGGTWTTVNIYNNTLANGEDAKTMSAVHLVPDAADTVTTLNFYNNIMAFNEQYDFDKNTNGTITTLNINKNLYYKPGGYTGEWKLDGTAYDTIAGWRTAVSGEANSLTADPKFINRSTGNFKLQPDSPAIDTGQAHSYVYDISGHVLTGLTEDMGAEEYVTKHPLGY